MAVRLSDISGNDWCGSSCPKKFSEQIMFFFGLKLPMTESSIGKSNRVMDWLPKCIVLKIFKLIKPGTRGIL